MRGVAGRVAGNEMCYLGEMLWGYRLVFTPISALRSNSNTELYCRSCQKSNRGKEEQWEEERRAGRWSVEKRKKTREKGAMEN